MYLQHDIVIKITILINRIESYSVSLNKKHFLKFLKISNILLYGDHFDNFKSNNKNPVPEDIPRSNVKRLGQSRTKY